VEKGGKEWEEGREGTGIKERKGGDGERQAASRQGVEIGGKEGEAGEGRDGNKGMGRRGQRATSRQGGGKGRGGGKGKEVRGREG